MRGQVTEKLGTMAASTMLRPTLPSTVEISKKEFIRFLGGPVVEPVTAC